MIDIEHVTKNYRLGGQGRNSYQTLRESLVEGAGRVLDRIRSVSDRFRTGRGKRQASPRLINALNDVSFKVAPGEAVGVIGHNGAGKSTLLKVLSRITEPTSGRVLVRGRVGSLLEVGTGFHPELTGRENIFLNGAILGMPRREIARKLDQIVAFAEVEEFLDTPVKRYSSGMFVRLGYAVSAHMDPDILLVDEVLSVGDLKFQRKCMEHAASLVARSASVLLVSHNMFAIRALCKRAVYLRNGEVQFDGPVDHAVALYEKDSLLTTPPWAESLVVNGQDGPPIAITSIDTYSVDGRPHSSFEHGQPLKVRIGFEVLRTLRRPNFIVALIRSDNVACCNFNTAMDGVRINELSEGGEIELITPPLKLVSGSYSLQVLVRDDSFQKLYCARVGPSIQVRHDLLSTHFGVFHEAAHWNYAGRSWGAKQGRTGAPTTPVEV
jgi:lipopolysaccharide transport system ATP-binding protein